MKSVFQLDAPAKDFETITVSDSAIGLTGSKASVAKGIYLSTEGADLRFRIDGTDPTSAVGHLLTDGSILQLMGQTKGHKTLTQLKMIRDAATDVTVSVTYY